jgi:hypothetical protein
MTLIMTAIATDGIVCAADSQSASASESWKDTRKILDLATHWEKGLV